jgi:hypothetical protein
MDRSISYEGSNLSLEEAVLRPGCFYGTHPGIVWKVVLVEKRVQRYVFCTVLCNLFQECPQDIHKGGVFVKSD